LKYCCILLSNNQKYLISITCDLCCLIMLLTIPTVVVLSMCIGVGGCVWPSSARMSHKTLASCAFKKSAPSSTSAAEAVTSLRMVHVIRMAPFSLIRSPSWGILPRKKWPPAQLRAFWCREVQCVRVNIVNHVRGTVPDN
jgi:hypothetical protein